MIRWFIQRDGTKVLQEQNHYGDWDNVPEIDEKQESIQKALEQEERELNNERIRKRLAGKTYRIIGQTKDWMK